MTMDFRLINLDCPACGSAMKGESSDLLFFCTHCGSAAILGDDELELIESHALLPLPGRRAEVWKPAWKIDVDINISDRRLFRGRKTPDSSDKRSFLIPAFAMPVSDLALLSRGLSKLHSTAAEVPHEPCRGGTLAYGDALSFIRYLVVGGEVERPDKLASIKVEITDLAHEIYAIPFQRADRFLICSLTGIKIRNGGAA